MVVYEIKPYAEGWHLLRDGAPTAQFSSAHKAVAMAMHLVARERQAGHEVRLEHAIPPSSESPAA